MVSEVWSRRVVGVEVKEASVRPHTTVVTLMIGRSSRKGKLCIALLICTQT